MVLKQDIKYKKHVVVGCNHFNQVFKFLNGNSNVSQMTFEDAMSFVGADLIAA